MSFFSVHSSKADVEDLMSRVAQKLQQRELLGDIGSMDSALFPALNETSDTQGQLRLLTAQWSINSAEIIHSTRPVFGPAVIRFQRIVRKATWWFLNPILDQIIAFNGNVVRTLSTFHNRQEGMQNDLDEIRMELHAMRVSLPKSIGNGVPSDPEADQSVGASNGRENTLAGESLAVAELHQIKEALARFGQRLDEIVEAGSRDKTGPA